MPHRFERLRWFYAFDRGTHEQVAVVLHSRGVRHGVRLDKIHDLSLAVEAMTRIPLPDDSEFAAAAAGAAPAVAFDMLEQKLQLFWNRDEFISVIRDAGDNNKNYV